MTNKNGRYIIFNYKTEDEVPVKSNILSINNIGYLFKDEYLKTFGNNHISCSKRCSCWEGDCSKCECVKNKKACNLNCHCGINKNCKNNVNLLKRKSDQITKS